MMPKAFNTFEAIRSHKIESLDMFAEEYRHKKTGAIHYHLNAKNNENVFLVALRTVPEDSSGVAHILEHTALCGSERYPVRDPFFMMIRRSLNTFMNAFTSSDWTAYPFASQNKKDFDNLLSVYLDAVFFSRLDPLDFAQEGHRLEFEDSSDLNSPLVYKGVVYNEMKGAMSSVTSTLWQTLCHHLFPTSTYHFNSGGEPSDIPALSYEELKAFYTTHYHPSNAIFMTFGDIAAADHQQKFEQQALHRFDKLSHQISVPLEQRFEKPKDIEETYSFTDPEGIENSTHYVMAWLLGESNNVDELLEAQLLSSVLLDNSASPLQKALETTTLANAPSPMCGLEDSMRELVFCCGVEGSKKEDKEAVFNYILDTIKSVAENGVDKKDILAILHQLELSQREIGGDSYPFGLQIILNSLNAASHRCDPIALIDLEPAIERLTAKIANPDFIKQLVQRLLLDNPHRISLSLLPDETLAEKTQQAELEKLTTIKNTLNDQQKKAIVDQTFALQKRQDQVDDESILPKIELSDVPKSIPELTAQALSINTIPTSFYAQGTNGICYQQWLTPLPDLSEDETSLLPYYCDALTEVGLGSSDYLSVQQRQSQVCGGIYAYTNMRATVDNEQNSANYFVLSSKALNRNHEQQTTLMVETLSSARFNEQRRLSELVSQKRARKERSITSNGHGLAMAAACSGMSPLANMNHRSSGLASIQAIRDLEKSLQTDSGSQSYATALDQIHQKITQTEGQLLVVAESDSAAKIQHTLNTKWPAKTTSTESGLLSTATIRETRKELWVTNTQVNFCAKAYPTVAVEHPDAAALVVLGGFLRNGFLHQAIREKGGAYGGGASQDTGIAAFKFYSYRDPRIEGTLNDFDASIAWLSDHNHGYEQLEQAILGVVASLDKPASPAGEAKQDFYNALFGRTHKQRTEFRQKVLNVTVGDLQHVGERYLNPERASIAVITNEAIEKDQQAYLKTIDFDHFTL